ncbi:MAG: hypothetical protein JOZ18_01950 [Chloroflexi bacterium]|nr:hypothetical protein [Chloroflexota bacterium]
MRTQSRDTSPQAERVLIDLIRKAPITKRFDMVRSLTASTSRANMQYIQNTHPRASQAEIAQIFAARPRNQSLQMLARSLGKRLENRTDWTLHESDVLVVLRSIADTFEKLQVPYYFSGSVVSSVYGMQQLAQDIDVVIDPEASPHDLMAHLQKDYHIDEQAIYQAVQQRTAFSMIHLDTLLKVDVIISRSRPFTEEMRSRVQWNILDQSHAPFPLVSPEDIVLVKLEHHGKAERVPDDQWNDILGVLKVQGSSLDLAYLEKWASCLDVADLLNQACLDAGLKE